MLAFLLGCSILWVLDPDHPMQSVSLASSPVLPLAQNTPWAHLSETLSGVIQGVHNLPGQIAGCRVGGGGAPHLNHLCVTSDT